jgi:MFS family permease
VPEIEPALDGKLNDIMSSGYGFFYNLASMIGPISGGLLFDAFGYRGVLDINMFFEFSVMILFAIFNCGFNVFKNDAYHKREMKKMKKVSEIIIKIAEKEKFESDEGMLNFLDK